MEDKKVQKILKKIDTPKITEEILYLIKGSLRGHSGAFDQSRAALKESLKHEVSLTELLEMICQHILIKPLFAVIFPNVSELGIYKILEDFSKLVDQTKLHKELNKLEDFYEHFKYQIDKYQSFSQKQENIKNFFELFYKKFFPKKAELMGIVYTPCEVVDFMLHSVEEILRKHFNASINDKAVEILDPFTGIGTFIVQLLTSGLISSENLERKFLKEISAYEIVPFSYYVAAMNIEEAFSMKTNEKRPFLNLELADTFKK